MPAERCPFVFTRQSNEARAAVQPKPRFDKEPRPRPCKAAAAGLCTSSATAAAAKVGGRGLIASGLMMRTIGNP